jgi:dTDP-4-dehydrorhamnose 3,5-epimerase-like enzyme
MVFADSKTAMQHLYTVCRNANAESRVRWSDPQIGIKWPLAGDATLSEKDATAQPREEWIKRPESHLF